MIGISDIKKIFDQTHESINQIGLLARWLNKKYDFTKAAESYKKRLDELYDNIKIIGMSEPMKLRSIYTRVNVLEKITALKRVSVKELEQYYDKDRRAFKSKTQTLEGIEVVNQFSKLVLLGKPGAGKTTFLKYITLQTADGLLKEKRIPIFISLKEWSDSDKPLMVFIVEQFDICRFEKAEPFIDRMLNLGKCLLLLDGLDEVSSDKEDNIIKQVLDFSNKYKDNAFIISCRIAAYKYLLQHFKEIELADFDDGQIKHFINSWFGINAQKAELCWKAMENDPPIKELACVPLLLTLLCLNFSDTMEFAKNKGELYKIGIEALLNKWDTSRNIKRQQIYKNFSSDRKKTMLSQIAAISFEKNEYFMPQRLVEEYISDFIKNIPGVKEEDLLVSSEGILKSIEAQHGILIERAEKIYSFSHLTFQEYFTANNILENKDKGSFEGLADSHLLNPKWREVILLTVGIVGNADNLLLAIKRKVGSLVGSELAYLLKQVINSNKLLEIIIESDEIPCLIEKFSLEVRILKVLAFCDRAIAIDLAHAIAIAIDRAIDLAHNRNRALALDRNRMLAIDLARVRARAIDRSIDRAIDLDFDLDRALALDCALTIALDRNRALAIAIDRNRVRDHHVLDRAIDLALDRAIGRDHAIGRGCAINLDLKINWFTEIVEVHNKLRTNTITISDIDVFNRAMDKAIPEINKLSDYLYATNLLVECLNSDCYISKETREKIMNELLTIPKDV